MRRETRRRVVSALARISFLCIAVVVCNISGRAAVGSEFRIICVEEVSAARREVLAERLRVITGLKIEFDSNGIMRVQPSPAQGGSQFARNLISKALSGPNIIAIEAANNRDDVVFSRVVQATWRRHASSRPPTFVVLIDFEDFDRLMGDEAALKAFDAGWAFLHELDHVVNNSLDSTAVNDAGDCEDHINIMRRECNLPVRAEYFFTYLPVAEQSSFHTRFVRLAFDDENIKTKKRRRYWIMWDAILVGGLASDVAAAR